MRRREFIVFGGSAMAGPLGASAQQSEPVRRVGVLMNTTANDVEGRKRISAFLERLHALGWTEGQNVQVDTRWASGKTGGYRKSTTELVTLMPDTSYSLMEPPPWPPCWKRPVPSQLYS